MPIDYSKYPKDWFNKIRPAILLRANHSCEGSPRYPDCRAHNNHPHPATGSQVVLTIAHLDHNIDNNEPDNLRAWCQRCHLTYDAKHHAQTRRRNANLKRRISKWKK